MVDMVATLGDCRICFFADLEELEREVQLMQRAYPQRLQIFRPDGSGLKGTGVLDHLAWVGHHAVPREAVHREFIATARRDAQLIELWEHVADASVALQRAVLAMALSAARVGRVSVLVAPTVGLRQADRVLWQACLCGLKPWLGNTYFFDLAERRQFYFDSNEVAN